MADFITCDSNSFTFETLLASLFSELDSDTTLTGLRIVDVSSETIDETPIQCSGDVTWKDLFKMALEVDVNGYAALRIYKSDAANSFADCGGGWDATNNLIRRSFVKLVDGTVALLLFSSGA